MLARIQQTLTLSVIALALLWCVLLTRSGHRDWAAAGLAMLICAPSLVLALEFVLMWRTHGTDPTPRAGGWQLLRAWWGETCATPRVFCWQQPFRSGRWPDHLSDSSRGRRGVLLIHGYFCNRGIWNRWLRRLTVMQVPFVAVNLEPVFGSIEAMSPLLESAIRQLQDHTGLAPVVVAHSMGGLVLRHWWSTQPDGDRVHHAITMGTPHRGTWLARLGFSLSAREMRQRSSWIQALVDAETPSRAARFTCFYSHCDNIVFPAVAATLAGADNRHLAGVAHVHMIDRDEPWAELVERLQ